MTVVPSEAAPAAGFATADGPLARLGLAARLAMRELRGGLAGFRIFIACIALGVATIGGVGSLARALTDGIAAEGRTILGGDVEVSLIHREASPEERALLEGLGQHSTVATLRAMARLPDGAGQALVEAKAVDAAYPLVGAVTLTGGGPLADAITPRGDGFGAVADPELLSRLGIAVGDVVELGRTRLTITDTLETEPDRLSGGIDFGPRLLASQAALAASGLVQPGSLVRWNTRIALPGEATDERVAAVVKEIETTFPKAGWRVQARTEAAPGLTRNIERFAQFLTLVGLTALVVGGVGVANAVASFVDRKRPVIATLRTLGASGDLVVLIHLIEVMAIAGVGIAIGVVLGAVIPPVAGALLAGILPIPALNGVFPQQLALAVVYGLLTALAFSLWPLGRAHDVPPTTLYRDRAGSAATRPRRRYMIATVAAALALAGIAVLLAGDRIVAAAFVGGAAAAFLLLRGVAAGVMALARRVPRKGAPELRLAVAAIHRPGALTPTVVLSLGLGLTLLVTLALIDGSLRRELTGRLPEQAPSFFFLDIQDREAAAFDAFLKETAPEATVRREAMLRGRFVALKGIAATDYPAPPEAEWVLRGDRGITYSPTLPGGSTLTAGEWWPADYAGPPLVSFAEEPARELGLTIGDDIRVNVLGREIDAKIANLRTVDWQSLGINFVLVFSPNTFAGAPHTHLATLALPDEAAPAREQEILAAVTSAFPTVTAIRVKDALDAVSGLVEDLALAVRAAAGVALAASVLVLAGALAASHAARIREAAILQTLGATRGRLVTAFALEYLLLGLSTAIFAIAAGSAAAWAVLTLVMDIPFAFDPLTAAAAALVALVVTVGLGLVGTWRVLGHRLAPALRDL
jgi:putative ABC transport system permease protein